MREHKPRPRPPPGRNPSPLGLSTLCHRCRARARFSTSLPSLSARSVTRVVPSRPAGVMRRASRFLPAPFWVTHVPGARPRVTVRRVEASSATGKRRCGPPGLLRGQAARRHPSPARVGVAQCGFTARAPSVMARSYRVTPVRARALHGRCDRSRADHNLVPPRAPCTTSRKSGGLSISSRSKASVPGSSRLHRPESPAP